MNVTTTERKSLLDGLGDVLLAWFLAEVAFIVLPLSLYLPNQRDFDYDLTLIAPYLCAALIAFVVLLPLLFLKPPLRGRIVVVLFCAGVYLALRDAFCPVQMGEMRDTILLEPIRQPVRLVILDIAIFVVALICAFKLPVAIVKRPGVVIVCVLLLTEGATVWKQLSRESHFTGENTATVPPPATLAGGGNIYHITFDAFSGLKFLDEVDDAASREAFDGFVFFQKNRSNYDYTTVSVGSFMTGNLYPGGSLKQFVSVWHTGGLIGNLHAAGYEVWQYVNGRSWVNEHASHVTTTAQFRKKYHDDVFHFADLWSLRLAPQYLKRRFYQGTKGIVSRKLSRWVPTSKLDTLPLGSAEMMRQLIADEDKRPASGQYVYCHIYLPHFPYVLNRDCQYAPGVAYNDQSLCAVRLMTELIAKLKQQGKYDQALIIFQSDHGWHDVGPKDPSVDSLPKELEESITRTNLLGLTARGITNLSHGLLVIKAPSHSDAPLAVSDLPTQLADIPATVYQLKGLNVKTDVGRSVFEEDFPAEREIPFFVGFDQMNAKGLLVRFGQSIFSGEMNHFAYDTREGWKIYPNMSATW